MSRRSRNVEELETLCWHYAGSAQRSSLKAREGAIAHQPNIGTVLKARLGNFLRGELDRAIAFPSTYMYTILRWREPNVPAEDRRSHLDSPIIVSCTPATPFTSPLLAFLATARNPNVSRVLTDGWILSIAWSMGIWSKQTVQWSKLQPLSYDWSCRVASAQFW